PLRPRSTPFPYTTLFRSVRPGARGGRQDRDDARTAFERLHDVVLRELAVRVLRGVRLGRAIDRHGELDAGGDDVRPELVGTRSQIGRASCREGGAVAGVA